ncbi:MAG: hypothetical protein M1814_003793 [Vezdaea aestivalis]|nr:MAG: hypothetical protein M1814_003793 [Vezdaea aestivalis]
MSAGAGGQEQLPGEESYPIDIADPFYPKGSQAYPLPNVGNDTDEDNRSYNRTKYINLLIEWNSIPFMYNAFAGLFTSIILAAYVVLPGTFTSLRNSKAIENATGEDRAKSAVLDTVRNVPLLGIASPSKISDPSEQAANPLSRPPSPQSGGPRATPAPTTMAFLFGRSKQKGTADLPRLVKALIPALDYPDSPKGDEFAKLMAQMKQILQGTQDTDTNPEQVGQLVQSVLSEDLLYLLAKNVHIFSFEARKDTQVVFSYMFRYVQTGNTEPLALTYVLNQRPEVIVELCRGYENAEGAGSCGNALREVCKHDAIAELILYDEPGMPSRRWDPNKPSTGRGAFWQFFHWINDSNFEVSADAFATFRDILIKHKQLISQYLLVNFDRFFTNYNTILMRSMSYVTKRQSIKLLGEILLDRSNYPVMTAYVADGENLKIVMQLLKDDRRMVQYEGFHVFKVFVANPKKSPAVLKILINNKARLLRFLPVFLEERTEDEQFQDERAFLIKQIESLPDRFSEGLEGSDRGL